MLEQKSQRCEAVGERGPGDVHTSRKRSGREAEKQAAAAFHDNEDDANRRHPTRAGEALSKKNRVAFRPTLMVVRHIPRRQMGWWYNHWRVRLWFLGRRLGRQSVGLSISRAR